MLAARAHDGETELRLEDVEVPVAGPGEVLIEVASASLSPSLLEFWQIGMMPLLPQTVGHEAAGTIAAVGDGVREFAVGDRVSLYPTLTCRRCEYCLTDREQLCSSCSLIGHAVFGPEAMPLYERYHHGALAEYVLAPAWAVDPLPDSVSFDAAAVVHDVAVALRALKAAAPRPGATVVWTAATGTVGTAAVKLAPLLGIRRLIAVARSSERLAQVRALAPELVETVALDSLDDDWEALQGLTGAIRELAPPGGADAVIDCFPEGAATWQAIASLKPGGNAVVMGRNATPPPFPTLAFVISCWSVQGNRNCTREDVRQVMAWLASGVLKIDDLFTHRFALSDVADAVDVVRRRSEPTWMTVVHPRG